MNKKGQFFLIAALVIAGIVVTLGAVYVSTRSTPQENTRVYDLSDEIDYETNRVIDYGVFSGENIEATTQQLMFQYSTANPNTDLVIIYGDASGGVSGVYYNPPAGSVSLTSGGSTLNFNQRQIGESRPLTAEELSTEGAKATVIIGDYSRDFELKPGENFYIVLSEQKGGEQYVATK